MTHGHWDHLVGVAELAEGTGAQVYMAEGERSLLEDPSGFTPPAITLRPYTPDVLLEGGETIERRRHRVRRALGARPLARSPRVPRRRLPLLRRRAVRRLGRAHRPPGADWDTLLASIRTLVDTLPPDTVVYPGHGPTTTLGDELARNPFLAELRAERTG